MSISSLSSHLKFTEALTGETQWAGHHPVSERSQVQFLARARAWVAGWLPGGGMYERQPIKASLLY